MKKNTYFSHSIACAVGAAVVSLAITTGVWALLHFSPDNVASRARAAALNETALEGDAEMNAFLIGRMQELLATYRLREYGHRSWDELASSHLNIPEKDIRYLDRGKRPLLAEELIAVCKALGVSLAQFLNPEYPLGIKGLPLRIAQRRIELGLDRAALAKEAGLSVETVKRLETRQESMDVGHWRRVAAALDMDVLNPGDPVQTTEPVLMVWADREVSREIWKLMTAAEWLRLNEQRRPPNS